MSDAEAERALCDLSMSGRGGGRDSPPDELAVDGFALGAWNPLVAFFLGTGAGDDPDIEEGVAAEASYSSATATVGQLCDTLRRYGRLTHRSVVEVAIIHDEVVGIGIFLQALTRFAACIRQLYW